MVALVPVDVREQELGLGGEIGSTGRAGGVSGGKRSRCRDPLAPRTRRPPIARTISSARSGSSAGHSSSAASKNRAAAAGAASSEARKPASRRASRPRSARSAGVLAGRLRVLERLEVVVRQQLRLLLRAAERLDPLRRRAVLLVRAASEGSGCRRRRGRGCGGTRTRSRRRRTSAARGGRTPFAPARAAAPPPSTARARRSRASAPTQTTLPRTAASWSTSFSSAVSASSRAAMIPWMDSGQLRRRPRRLGPAPSGRTPPRTADFRPRARAAPTEAPPAAPSVPSAGRSASPSRSRTAARARSSSRCASRRPSRGDAPAAPGGRCTRT